MTGSTGPGGGDLPPPPQFGPPRSDQNTSSMKECFLNLAMLATLKLAKIAILKLAKLAILNLSKLPVLNLAKIAIL